MATTLTRDPMPIELRGLTKLYGPVRAVNDLTCTIAPNRVTGFLGPNGAGKTTTLRMILDLVTPTNGSAVIGVHRYRELTDPLRHVGAALEATSFHPGRTGRDHLRVLAAAASIPTSRVDEVLDLTGIAQASRRRAGGYSLGMRQRLALAAALLGDPTVLILDEPANGLDPAGIRWLRNFLHQLSREGRTVLVSSHLLHEVEQTVDDVLILNRGVLVRGGSIESLRGAPKAIVRTSDPGRLAGALRLADVTSVAGETEDGLIADTDDLRLVGDVALRAGLPLWELSRQTSGLEQLFFQLTSRGSEDQP